MGNNFHHANIRQHDVFAKYALEIVLLEADEELRGVLVVGQSRARRVVVYLMEVPLMPFVFLLFQRFLWDSGFDLNRECSGTVF